VAVICVPVIVLFWIAAPSMDTAPAVVHEKLAEAPSQPEPSLRIWPRCVVASYHLMPLVSITTRAPLAAVRKEMRVNIAASEQTASTLENWGIPAGAWVAPKGADLGPADQRLIARALRALRQVDRTGVPFLRIGLPDSYVHLVGSHNWLLDHYGFAPQAIAASARQVLEGK